RLNIDVLTPKGSGYVASRHPDFLLANDEWARFINLQYGPDGNVYLIDWYDKQACHTNDAQVWDRSNGRIYKVVHRDSKWVPVDLTKKTNEELVDLQSHPNDWFARHARRLLLERAASGRFHPNDRDQPELNALRKLAKLREHESEAKRLRALWTYHALGLFNEGEDLGALKDSSPHVRAWAIRLASEQGQATPKFLEALVTLAQDDPSPGDRLYLGSAAHRVPLEHRWPLLRKLVAHAEDAADHNLPLMIWYALEPLAEVDADRAHHLAMHAEIPLLLQFMTRRIATTAKPADLEMLVG